MIRGIAKALLIIAALLAIPFIIAGALGSAKGDKR